MPVYRWSQTAASNGAADPTASFPEGMSPSAVNDGVRGAMAAVAMYRDDIAGAIVTGGTANAYTVASFSGFTSLAFLDKQMIAFSPHVTNGDTVTLNVDGLGTKPLRSAPGVELVAGTLIQGTPYAAVYSNSDGAFYLQGYYSSPYNIPFLMGGDYWDTVTPNSAFIFPMGQAISRTVYARAFGRWGTKFGAGDGSTTFNVPDKTERVSVMMAAAASRLPASFFGGDSTQLGAVGGSASHTLTATEIPAHTHPNTLTDPGHAHGIALANANAVGNTVEAPGSSFVGNLGTQSTTTAGTNITINNANNTGGGNAHAIVQPTIVCNYIIRIL
jgi:microcystin-dependent protein